MLRASSAKKDFLSLQSEKQSDVCTSCKRNAVAHGEKINVRRAHEKKFALSEKNM